MGGAIAMAIASFNNIVLTIAFVLAHQLVPRTWGAPSPEALKVWVSGLKCSEQDSP